MPSNLEAQQITAPRFPMECSKVLVLYTGGTIGMKDFGNGYEPVPHLLEKTLRENSLFSDPHYASITKQGDPILLPSDNCTSSGKTLKPVMYTVKEYSVLIDSCSMKSKDYIDIASDIANNYYHYDAFVVLQGTDTLAYTSSVLSFMMENLGKTIIVTGSQIPIYEQRSDGRDNLLSSLQLAGHYIIPEVTVFFDNNLFRGNRVSKTSSVSFHAFRSPNMVPLVELGVEITVNWPLIWKPLDIAPFKLFVDLNSNVAILRIFPSMTPMIMKKFLEPPIEGIVLQTYGAGNMSLMNQEVLDSLKEATQRGILIINVTQCQKGAVMSVYATGKVLLEVGVVPGGNMTPEAAIAKLMYVLGKPWSLEEKRTALARSLRGEMHTEHDEAYDLEQSGCNSTLLDDLAKAFRLPTAKAASNIRDQLLPALINAAVADNNLETLEKLGNFMGHYQIKDSLGRSPLHNAAILGSEAATEFLLSKGCLVNCVDNERNTPLFLATIGGHIAVINLLLQAGANLSTVSKYKIGADLCTKAANGDLSALKGFKQARVDLNQGDYDQRRPLHLAVHFSQVETVEYLLENDCNVELKDNFGRTPQDEVKTLPDGSNKQKIEKLLQLHATNSQN